MENAEDGEEQWEVPSGYNIPSALKHFEDLTNPGFWS